VTPATPGAPQPAPKQFHLGQASTALVTQAHAQAAAGNAPLALVTIERALRIEPDNPLLWIELGEVHAGTGNYAQADAMGHKALQLASGDTHAQSSAWRLIADSLRARGRNPEAADADARARALSAR
jgi:Flp pilus assembly protein TadD